MKYEGYEGALMFTRSDLQKLMGNVSRATVYREHRKLREEICGNRRGSITIREFCEHKGFDPDEIIPYIRKEDG